MQTRPDWQAAKEQTIASWLTIREMVAEPDELQLLTEINAVCGLCEAATASSKDVFGRCDRCLFYQQFGGCQGINGDMSERVVEKDWEGLLELIDRFVAHLEALEVPAEGDLTHEHEN